MAIADKLLELNDVKQDIKTAIEGKGVSMTGVPFTGYSTKIDSITTGPGMSYHDYAKMLYSMYGFGTQFTEAWTESQNSLDVLFEIPLMLVAPNQNLGGMDLDLYAGTDSALADFYNLVVGEEFPKDYAIIINKSVIRYQGDVSIVVDMPFPIYAFGMFFDNSSPAVVDQFFIADLTPLGMGLGITLGKLTGVAIPDNSITIRRGFDNYAAGLIIPEMIEIVGELAFDGYNSISAPGRAPYIIGHNVKYIGEMGFKDWNYRLPLNIPDSVEWIGIGAFRGYANNRNFIVIPRNVTYMGASAFAEFGTNAFEQYVQGVPGVSPAVVIMYPEIPPVLGFEDEVGPFPSHTGSIYVPDNAVSAYKSAWLEYADKIEAISDLPSEIV